MSCASAADCTSGYCSGTCQTNPYDPNGCLKWNGQNALQDALDANDCVLVLPGTYDLGEALHVAAGKKLTGEAGMRATTILRASSTFDTTDVPLGRSSMILNSTTGNTTISHLTLDGSRRAVRIICCSNYMLDDVVVENATCDGVDVSGPGVVVQNSEIAFNASDGAGGGLCMSAAAPYGGGVYCQGYPAAISVNLQLLNNTIHDNFGMGIDINGCHHGTISGNNIYANNGPAAIGLYGASQWTVSGNAVSHPHNATYNPVFHPLCDGGPIGSGSAALYICQDTDANGFYSTENTVTDNHFSGKYGILSIGADEVQPYWAPRKSVFQSNVLTGSVFGCADDFAPGQWFSDDNVWAGNGCGTPTGAPVYF
jgi:parallel beta-helix repeat protein